MGERTRKTRKPARVEASDREILRALVEAAVVDDGASAGSLNWRTLVFDADALERRLRKLARPATAPGRRRLKAFAREFADRYRLRVSLSGDIPVPMAGGKAHLPRWLVGEALGALGSNLMPTRQRVRRIAAESARELAFFGYGKLGDQVLPHPIALVRGALAGEESLYLDPVLLDEEGPSVGRKWSVFDLLRNDEFFHRQVDGEAELARFQQRLREDPLDGNMVVKLREFFSKRATVGLRDTTRWVLGSRHPWFDWQRARKLIVECFEHWGTENFLCPRTTLYTFDVEISDDRLRAMLAANDRTVELFASNLAGRLHGSVRDKLADALGHLARAALDCHHDHPDFDLEARGRQGGETTARFVGHAMYVLASNFAGKEPRPRRNFNLAAHFEIKGVEKVWLGGLDEEEKASFYLALNGLLKDYTEQDGVGDGTGRKHVYESLPLVVYGFFEPATPRPRKGERVLDSFSLAELREPQHSKHLKAHPDVFEKLTVFFTLVLRHYLDTEHAPDLRPERLVRDFMLLGLWGTNSPNLVINLYESELIGKVRSEIRFLGRTQVKGYRPEEDRKYEAALARLMASQLGPLIEPSMLRSVGAFLMAAEESVMGSRVQEMGTIAFAKHTLELFREAARTGIKGPLVDLATLLEMLVDNSVDLAQRGLDRFSRTQDRKG